MEFDQQTLGVMMGSEPTGPPGANIFIFHVPNDWSHQDLLNNFGHFGHVISARIASDKSTGRNRGFAFVSYDDAHAAVQAVSHMNGFMAQNKRLKVTIKKGEEQYVQNIMPPMVPAGPGSGMPPSCPPTSPAPGGMNMGGGRMPMMGVPGGHQMGGPPMGVGPQPVASYGGFPGYAPPQGHRYAPY
jgi:RNA recognition motif-containing protein